MTLGYFKWAAASLCKETLPAEAVKYIRSAASARNSWWPAHGMELDIWCLTTGVVNEERGRQQSDTRNDDDGDKKDNTREIRKVCIIKPQFRIQITPLTSIHLDFFFLVMAGTEHVTFSSRCNEAFQD